MVEICCRVGGGISLGTLAQHQIQLILPKKEFIPGEKVGFELDAPPDVCFDEGLMQLRQNLIYTTKNSRGRSEMKFKSTIIELNNSNLLWGFLGKSCNGEFEIPKDVPPTVKASDSPGGGGYRISEVERVLGIQYTLEVYLSANNSCGGFFFEDFPIEIKNKVPTPRQGRSSEGQGQGSRQRQATTQDHGSQLGELLLPSQRRSSGRDDPPRYSMLSLPTSSRTTSMETLPPLYEDTMRLNRHGHAGRGRERAKEMWAFLRKITNGS